MLKSINFQDLKAKIYQIVDTRVKIITAGLNIRELANVLRGDPPEEKPNPRYRVHTTSFWFHIRPRYYEKGSTIFTHTFRLGFFTTFFFVIEFITGIILMVYYSPTPSEAYTSILNLESNVPFGQILRDLHRLGAEGMVIFTFLHMMRTFLTGSYKKERSFTWFTGVFLLGITLFLSFFGYLLPWDQLAYWAVTIGTGMAEAAPLFGKEANLLLRGAPDIGAGGLLRAYLLHVVLLPAVAVILISVHYYKVSREHGISQPASVDEGEISPEIKKNAKQRVDYIPDLLTHEVFLTSLGIFAMVAAIVMFGYSAPLEHIANPQVTPLDTKAPWYFWWLQGMLKLGDKTLMGVIIPTILAGLLIAIPYIDRNPYRSLYKRPIAVGIGLLFVTALIALSYMGTPHFHIATPAATRIVQDLAPEEGQGSLRDIPFDQLQKGVYQVADPYPHDLCPELSYGCPALTAVFQDFSQRVIKASTDMALPKISRLPKGQGYLIIEDWQLNLKKITFRIIWDDPDTGTQKTYERRIFIHRDHGSE